MPSIRSILTGLALTTFTLLEFTSATPLPPKENCVKNTAVLPVNGGARELAASTLKLAHVTVGRGVQNYTCSAPGAAPVQLGAIATLYDGSALANKDTKAFHTISAKAVYKPVPPGSLDMPPPVGKLPIIGKHYFDAAGTPTFDLTNGGKKQILFAAKNDSITAPTTADVGPAKTGAVPWLLLNAKAGYTSVGLKQVYRVVTSGGVGPTCTTTGVETVQYAAEYWFYN